MVNLVKSDFKFNCTQNLTVGKVNKVALGVDNDYKPGGDMIGDYTPNIAIIYNETMIPCEWDSTLNDYCFDLDLTDKTTEGKVHFNVVVDTNDVLNQSITEVILNSEYETINSLSKFTSFIRNGGIGRLGANITLTNDITVNKDCYIIGNNYRILLNAHKFIISTNKIFKATGTLFTRGTPVIHQKIGSKVELTDCVFNINRGVGSVIECDIELHSLENPNDFTTIINDCTFNGNDMCILHGGDLTVQNCTVNSGITNPSYPFFLYQTDGNATLIGNTFNISAEEPIDYDIEFNSCIFMCGETAQVNGLSHVELQNNNIDSFLNVPQNNNSSIDLTYYYDLIESNIILQSNKGFCHSVSGVDYIFKTGISATRG